MYIYICIHKALGIPPALWPLAYIAQSRDCVNLVGAKGGLSEVCWCENWFVQEMICVKAGLFLLVGAKRGLRKSWLVKKLVCVEACACKALEIKQRGAQLVDAGGRCYGNGQEIYVKKNV